MFANNMKPTYKHDCPKCRFLGATWKHYADPGAEGSVIDWYECEGSDPSVIGRASSVGSDYWSSPTCLVTLGTATCSATDMKGTYALDPMRIIAWFMLNNFQKENV